MPNGKDDLTPPIKWHGGKQYLAKRIIALFPQHVHYVEPYFGGGAVLLHKDPEGVSEVVNDLNGDLVNFWRVMAKESQFQYFVRKAEATPCCEAIFDEAMRILNAPQTEEPNWLRAWAFFVVCRQSRAATFKDFTTISKTRTRRGMNELPSAWLGAIEGLRDVHARLMRVVILNRPALDVIQQNDRAGTLTYADPPYLHETRATADSYGKHEMSRDDHVKLLDVLRQCRGKVALSGYPNELYDSFLHDWNRHDHSIPNHAAGGDTKRRMTECVWCNF